MIGRQHKNLQRVNLLNARMEQAVFKLSDYVSGRGWS